jgi:hypothetical protein
MQLVIRGRLPWLVASTRLTPKVLISTSRRTRKVEMPCIFSSLILPLYAVYRSGLDSNQQESAGHVRGIRGRASCQELHFERCLPYRLYGQHQTNI